MHQLSAPMTLEKAIYGYKVEMPWEELKAFVEELEQMITRIKTARLIYTKRFNLAFFVRIICLSCASYSCVSKSRLGSDK